MFWAPYEIASDKILSLAIWVYVRVNALSSGDHPISIEINRLELD